MKGHVKAEKNLNMFSGSRGTGLILLEGHVEGGKALIIPENNLRVPISTLVDPQGFAKTILQCLREGVCPQTIYHLTLEFLNRTRQCLEDPDMGMQNPGNSGSADMR